MFREFASCALCTPDPSARPSSCALLGGGRGGGEGTEGRSHRLPACTARALALGVLRFPGTLGRSRDPGHLSRDFPTSLTSQKHCLGRPCRRAVCTDQGSSWRAGTPRGLRVHVHVPRGWWEHTVCVGMNQTIFVKENSPEERRGQKSPWWSPETRGVARARAEQRREREVLPCSPPGHPSCGALLQSGQPPGDGKTRHA